MSLDEAKFELPRNIERYLAALSKLYAKEGKKLEQAIIVNSTVRVHEEWSGDNWDGGAYGHALYLVLPEPLYLRAVEQKDHLQNQIREDINKIHTYQHEFIEKVFFEMEVRADQDWRKESGALLSSKRVVLPETEKRIWRDGNFRVFLSHKAEVKKQVADLKNKLLLFGVSSFVAHEVIEATREWQDEIENALHSMDAFVALMTNDFHDSDWTDQEVGFAFGRGVPIIAIRLGKDPYGFIGKFQALSCSWEEAPKEIVKLLIKHDRMLNAYIKAIRDCDSFDQGNKLAEYLPSIKNISDQQALELISAFNENSQVRESYGFNAKKPGFGSGLVFHLNRLTGKIYRLGRLGRIELTA